MPHRAVAPEAVVGLTKHTGHASAGQLAQVVSHECLCCLEHLQILTTDAVYCWPSCLSNTTYALQSTLTSESSSASSKAGSEFLHAMLSICCWFTWAVLVLSRIFSTPALVAGMRVAV